MYFVTFRHRFRVGKGQEALTAAGVNYQGLTFLIHLNQHITSSSVVPVDLKCWQVGMNSCPVKKFGCTAPLLWHPVLFRSCATNGQIVNFYWCHSWVICYKWRVSLWTCLLFGNSHEKTKGKKTNKHSWVIRWQMKVCCGFSSKAITSLLRSAVN